MDIFEFELRFLAYQNFSRIFKTNRDETAIIKLVQISDGWTPQKKMHELTPDELKELTLATYTNHKKDFLDQQKDINYKHGTLVEYLDRLEYELKVIKEMGFNTYMLIVQDYVNRAKKNLIVVWPGRWSGAGSMLSRLIGITDIDPFAYDLLFERFLNPARITMPDFDIDFDDEQREKVIHYVTEKYGSENVCAIGTYMKLATKAAFKDAARAIGIPFDRSNLISNMIPEKMSMYDAVHSKEGSDELRWMYESDHVVKRAVDLGNKIEGNLRQLWVHACGVIISPKPVVTYTPVQYINNDPELWFVSQYDGPTLETIGLLKMDFLWLRNLTVIKNCIRIIEARHQKEWKQLPEIFQEFLDTTQFHPPLDDEYTYEKVFQQGDTTGIFQFEGEGMRRFLIQLKANNINDLVAMSALYRPWPLEFIPTYINRKHGKEEVRYMLPELAEILTKQYDETTVEDEWQKLTEDLGPIMDLTYGIAVYQEQLMFLVQRMAWFSLAEADILRRWVGKKKKDVIEKLKKEFITKSADFRNYKEETAVFIYEKMIEPAASYSFNKSHSVCYAYIAYQTWYLKAHFPLEFYAALLRSSEEDTDRFSFFINEVQTHGLEVKTPDINESFRHIAAIDEYIRVGFLAIKWIGSDVAEHIQEERKKGGEYTSLEDFLKRCDSVVNKKSLEWLVKSWALDRFNDRKTLAKNIPQLLERSKASTQMSGWLFGMDSITTTITFPQIYQTEKMEQLMMEYDVFKCFIGWHPLDWLYPYIKPKYNFITQFDDVDDFGPFTMIGYIKAITRARKKGFFVSVEDISGIKEFFIKEMLDLKVFDLLLIQWFKGRSATLEKVTRLDRDKLIQKAKDGKKYDESMSAAKAKALRAGDIQREVTVVSTWSAISTTETYAEEIVPIEEEPEEEIPTPSESSESSYSFDLPEDINTIHAMIALIKEHQGDKPISIGWNNYSLTPQWITAVQQLLSS